MILRDALFAFLIAMIYAMLLIPLLGTRRVGIERFLLFFGLLFLVIWAAAVWFRPLGPSLYGEPWLVMLGLGAIFALFLAVLAEPGPSGPQHVTDAEMLHHRPPHERVEDLPPGATAWRASSPEGVIDQTAGIAFGVAFWFLLFLLLGLIFGNYALLGR